MKYAMHYIYWQKDLQSTSYVPLVARAKRLGFDALELGDHLIVHMPQSEVDALKAASEEHGLALTLGLDPTPDMCLTSDDAAVRQRGIDFYGSVFPRLRQLGITTLAGHLLNGPPKPPAAQTQLVELRHGAESLRQIGRMAQDYGISVNVEVVNRFQSHLLTSAAQGVAFVQQVGLPNVKLTLDTFHMNIEEDGMAAAILTAGEHLGHMHVEENNRRLPGTGYIAWPAIRDALHHIGYDGYLTFECLVRHGDELGDCAYIWRDFTDGADEEQLDRDAQSSLQFLKTVFKERSTR